MSRRTKQFELSEIRSARVALPNSCLNALPFNRQLAQDKILTFRIGDNPGLDVCHKSVQFVPQGIDRT